MKFRIKEIREKIGMTQEELSEKSGISRTTISGLENGLGRNTSSKTLLMIAKALGVPVIEIFFDTSV